MEHVVAARQVSWRRVRAGTMLALVVLLVCWGVVAGGPPQQTFEPGQRDADLQLYGAITDRMGDGDSYYTAVGIEQVDRGYPTRPAMTVREPTLAWLIAGVGGEGAARVVLATLLVAAGISMAARLRTSVPALLPSLVASVLSILTLLVMAIPKAVNFHEVWAGALIVLSLGLHTRRRWVLSVVLALLAAMIREHAVPYLLVMLVLAWREGCRKETVAWAAAVLAWAAFYGLHVARVVELVPLSPRVSPGWLAGEGWPLFVEMIRSRSPLVLFPFWIAAVLVPLALLGWWVCRTAYGRRVALTVTGYACAFSIVGRIDTTYWGFLLTVLVIPGAALAPSAIKVLGQEVRGRDPEGSLSTR